MCKRRARGEGEIKNIEMYIKSCDIEEIVSVTFVPFGVSSQELFFGIFCGKV